MSGSQWGELIPLDEAGQPMDSSGGGSSSELVPAGGAALEPGGTGDAPSAVPGLPRRDAVSPQPSADGWGPMVPLEDSSAAGIPDSVLPQILSNGEKGFDQAVELTHGDVAASLKAVRGVSPDVAAKLGQWAKERQVPFSFVLRQPEAFGQDAEARQIWDEISAKNEDGTWKYPGVAKWIQDPQNLALSRDDVATLRALEDMARNRANQDVGRARSILGSVGQGLVGVVTGTLKGFDTLRQKLEGPTAFENFLKDLATLDAIQKGATPEQVAQARANTATADQGFFYQAGQLGEDVTQKVMPTNPQYSQEFLSGRLPSIFGMMAGFFGGGELGALAQAPRTVTGLLAITSTAGGAYDEAKARGATEEQALNASAAIAPTGLLYAVIPNEMVAKLFQGGGGRGTALLLKDVLTEGGKGAGLFAGQTLASNAIAKEIYDKDRPYWDGVAQSGAGGGLASAIAASVVALATGRPVPASVKAQTDLAAGAQRVVDALGAKADKLQANLDGMEEMGKIVEASKLAGRDADAVAQFVSDAMGLHGVDMELTANARELGEVLYQGAKTPADVTAAQAKADEFAKDNGMTPEEFQRAMATGGDVKLNPGMLAAKYKGTPIWEAVKQGMVEDVAAVKQQMQDQLASLREETQTGLEPGGKLPEGLKPARETLMRPKEEGGAGLKAADAEKLLAPYAAGLSIAARERGLTVDEFLKERPVEVRVGGELPKDQKNLQNDERIAAETNAQINARAKNKEEVNSAMEERAAAAQRLSDSLKEGDLVTIDGEKWRVGKTHSKKGKRLLGTQLFSLKDGREWYFENGLKSHFIPQDQTGNVAQIERATPHKGEGVAFQAEAAASVPGEEHFTKPTQDMTLHGLRPEFLKEAGKPDKPVLLKKNIVEKNAKNHPDLTPADSRKILSEALYQHTVAFQSKPGKKTNYWNLVAERPGSKHGHVVVELSEAKDGYEVVNWHYLKDRTLNQLKERTTREGGRFLITKDLAVPASAGLSDVPGGKGTIPQSGDVVNQGERGAFYQEFGKSIIHLAEKGDPSTFLHEAAGHHLVDLMRELVTSGKASEQTVKDYGVLAKWAGVKQDKWTKDSREKVARGFEGYFLEGKAPRVELAGAFERFAQWLTKIYQSVKGYFPKLTDPVREVFDRRLASERQIEEARIFYAMKEDHSDLITQDTAKREMLRKKRFAAQQAQAERQAEKNLRAFVAATADEGAIAKRASEEVRKEPFYRMMEKSQAAGFDLEALKKTFGEKVAAEVAAKWPGAFREKGLGTVEEAALQFGFDSPEALLKELRARPDLEAAVKGKTADLMKLREEELKKTSNPGDDALATEADSATHGPKDLEYLAAETQALAEEVAFREGGRRERIAAQAIREAARQHLETEPVGMATRYDLYAKAEARHGRAALKALMEGDKAKALKSRKLQLINHALVAEAIKARAERSDMEKRFAPRALDAALKKVENDYALAATEILKRYGLTTRENPAPFDLAGVKEMDDTLYNLMPDFVRDGQKQGDYRQLLTMGEFRQLTQYVGDLLHYGRDVMRSLSDKEYATVTEFVAQSVDRMGGLEKRTEWQTDDTWIKQQLGKGMDTLVNNTLQMPFLTDKNDGRSFRTGGQLGPLGKLYQKTMEAEIGKIKAIGEMKAALEPHLKVLAEESKRIHKEHGEVFDVPELALDEVMAQELYKVHERGWTAEKLIALLLNSGNEWNLAAIENSYRFKKAELDAVGRYFSEDGLRAVQGVWDAIDTLYKPMDEVHFRLYNRHVEKVQAQPVTFISKDGKAVELKGGYYPLHYDPRLSLKAAGYSEEADIRTLVQRVYRRIKPEDGMTQSRVKGHGLPPKLSLGVLFDHVNDTTHLIQYSEVVRDWHRVTIDPYWKKVFTDKNGEDAWKQVRDWIEFQATPRTKGSTTAAGRWLDNIIESQKNLATVAALGLRIPSYFKNVSDFFHLAQELGGFHWIKKGFQAAGINRTTVFGAETSEARNFIKANSEYMTHREDVIQRELRESIDDIRATRGWKFTWNGREVNLRDLALSLMIMRDKATTTVGWMGAYHKYLETLGDKSKPMEERNKEAAQYADRVIQNTQPSSLKSELNALQRERGAWRALTMFGSWMAKFGSRIVSEGQAWREGKISDADYMRHIAYEIIGQGWFRLLIAGVIGGKLPDWWQWVTSPAREWTSWIPFVKDAPNFVSHGRVDVGAGLQKSLPLTEGAVRLGRAVNDSISLYHGRKGADVLAWDLGRVAEYFLGVPALNAAKDVMRTSDQMTGEKRFKEYK